MGENSRLEMKQILYLIWFVFYALMVATILLLHWQFRPDRDGWIRILGAAVLFEVPFQVGNILGITVFGFWQNNASSFFRILGSPIETVPFAFLGAVVALLLFREYPDRKRRLLLWLVMTFFCVLQAYVTTLLGFMTWVNWNIMFSFVFWLCLLGILQGLYLLVGYMSPAPQGGRSGR